MTVITSKSIATTTAGIMSGLLLSQGIREILTKVDGYIELCDHVTDIAEKAEKVHEASYQMHEQCEPGVWNYEVAEPLGEALGQFILNGEHYNEFDWETALKTLNDAFYSQE